MRLQGTYEWLRGKPVAAQKWWHKAMAETKRMGMRYDQGLIHLEMSQRLSEREHLRKAEVIFTEMGAEYDLTKVKALLHP